VVAQRQGQPAQSEPSQSSTLALTGQKRNRTRTGVAKPMHSRPEAEAARDAVSEPLALCPRREPEVRVWSAWGRFKPLVAIGRGAVAFIVSAEPTIDRAALEVFSNWISIKGDAAESFRSFSLKPRSSISAGAPSTCRRRLRPGGCWGYNLQG
jgi:hypothetical protein